MGWTFQSPPGWPQQPAGWSPPPGWTPDPSWPPPPAGWRFWVETPPATAQAAGGGVLYQPSGPAAAWFTRWWGIAGLAAALLVGGLVGFGGTSMRLSGGEDDPPVAPATATADPSAPAPTPSTGGPDRSPDPTPRPGDVPDEMCGEVAVIMLQMIGDNLDAFEQDDPQAELATSRREAAEALRAVEAADAADQDALDTFADELDAAADDLEGGPMTEDRYTEFVDRGTVAWDEFNATTGC